MVNLILFHFLLFTFFKLPESFFSNGNLALGHFAHKTKKSQYHICKFQPYERGV